MYPALSSTTPAGLYSVRAIGSYVGPLMRVRRSTDSVELDIYADANGDLDTVALLAHVGSANGYVVTWYDQSGNGRDAVVLAGLPVIVSAGVVVTKQGRPAVNFNKSQIMSISGFSYVAGAFTVMVSAAVTTGTWSNFLSNPRSTAVNGAASLAVSNGNVMSVARTGVAGTGSNLPVINGQQNVFTYTSTAGIVSGSMTVTAYINNLAGTQAATSSTALTVSGYGAMATTTNIGGDTQTTGDNFNGYITEMAIWNAVISDRVAAETAMRGYFSVSSPDQQAAAKTTSIAVSAVGEDALAVTKTTAYAVYGLPNAELEISKAVGYSVTQTNVPGQAISKSVAYSVTQVEVPGIGVSKSVAYTVTQVEVPGQGISKLTALSVVSVVTNPPMYGQTGIILQDVESTDVAYYP